MRGEAWTPDEDAVIRAEVAAGKGWIARCAPRLPHRTVGAIQVRASALRRLWPEPAAEAPPVAAPPRSSHIVPDGLGIPAFLADSPAFNRPWSAPREG